jgi:hypothetical protein
MHILAIKPNLCQMFYNYQNFYHGIGMALYNDYKDDEKVRDTIFNELSLEHKQSIINGMKECHELLSFFQL